MVTPAALLGSAEELALRDSEIWWRCSISRAYYAAFHYLREIAEEQVGLPAFGTADDHRDLERALRLIDRRLADGLAVLRRERNLADYALDVSISRLRASYAVEAARNLVNSQ